MIPNQSFYSDVILIFLEISGMVAALQPLWASCRCIVSSQSHVGKKFTGKFATDVKNCAWPTQWQLVEPSIHSDILVVMARLFFHVSRTVKRRNCPYWSEDNSLCIVESHDQNDPNNITCTVNIYTATDRETRCNCEVLQPYFDEMPLAMLGRFWFHQEGRTSTFGHNHSSII